LPRSCRAASARARPPVSPPLTPSPPQNAAPALRVRTGPPTSDEVAILRAKVQALSRAGASAAPAVDAPAAPAPSTAQPPSPPASSAWGAANGLGVVAAGGLAGALTLANRKSGALADRATEAAAASDAAMADLRCQLKGARDATAAEADAVSASRAAAAAERA